MSFRTFRTKNYLRGFYLLGDESFAGPVPPEYRWLPGDSINSSGKVEERRIAIRLHGILDLANRTGQGFTARGTPLYLFYPLDASWPPFYVSYKGRSDVNLLVTVQYEHWSSGRWPRGGLVKIHGLVGDLEVTARLLIESYGVSDVEDVSTPFPPVIREHTTRVWDRVFNIDPASTEDVDDIFAWREEDGKTSFMIAIADVAAWVPPDCEVDKRAQMLGETLYDNDGAPKQLMLPHSLTTRAASLRCDGVVRPVIGLIFTIQDGRVVEKTWEQTLVSLTDCYSYESFMNTTATHAKLKACLECVCEKPVDCADSHDMVAQAMITYNVCAARLLKGVGLGVLRRHSGISHNDYSAIAAISECADISKLGMAAGEYVMGSAEETAHAGLDVDAYCHASSPLRRYADLVNQRILKYLLFGTEWALGRTAIHANEFVGHLNARSKAVKRIQRDLLYLSHLRSDSLTTVEGIALECKDETLDRWSVYVPAWKRIIRGVGTGFKAGDCVFVRAFMNLRIPNFREQVVCQLSPA